MRDGEIDRIPVSQLIERYDLVRSAVYKRLEVLNIKPERVSNKAFVNADQIRLLDEFHRFIQAGGTAAEFLESRGLSRETSASGLSSGQSSGLSATPDIIQLVATIAAQFASKLQPAPAEPDPLAYFEALEKAAQGGWLLKTSEVAYLLDMRPADLQQYAQRYGESFSEAGFLFTNSGYRAGGEVAWKVSKLVR